MSDNKLYEMFKGVDPPPDQYTRNDVEEVLGPVAGDAILGTLAEQMQERFVEMTILEWELEEIAETLRARAATQMVERIAQGSLEWLAANATQFQLFDNEADAEACFEKQAHFQKCHSDFWYTVRTLFNCWNEFLSVRHDFVVVSTGKKYKFGA